MPVFTVGTFNPPADFFDFNLKYLFVVGLWPNENWPTNFILLYKIYQTTLFILSFTYLTTTGFGMYQHKDDMITFLSNMDKAIAAYNFIFKIIIFVFKRKRISILISEIIYSGDKIDSKRKRLMMMHAIAVFGMITSITGSFQVLAQIKGEMVVDAWLPFDYRRNQWTVFLAGQILGFLALVPLMYRAVAIQGIVCSIIMYLCDQLIELQGRFKNLKYSIENENYMRKEFKEIIKKHIRLMGYSKSMKSVFKEYFLIQNLAVTAELCLNALLVSIVGLDQKNRLISFMAFLMVALFNAYIFCHLGNELMDQSAGIALAAYESTWTSWPVDMQKDLLIVITVAQKSFKLSAGDIAFMNMQTFALALYNGYSMFAVLRDIVN